MADPGYYSLYLVQSAIASGCTYLNIYVERDHTILEHDGACPSPAELAGLFEAPLAAPETPAALLGLGLGTAVRRGLSRLEVALPEGEMASFSGGRLRLDSCSGTAARRIRLFWAMPWYRRLAVSLLAPELRLLRQRCAFAPVPVMLNGRLISGRFFGVGALRRARKFYEPEGEFHHLVEVRCLAGAPVPGCLCVPARSQAALTYIQAGTQLLPLQRHTAIHSWRTTNERWEVLPCRAVLAVPGPDGPWNGRVQLARYGVITAEHPHARLGRIVIAASDLRTDLTALCVLKDERYAERLAELDATLDRVLELVPQEHHDLAFMLPRR